MDTAIKIRCATLGELRRNRKSLARLRGKLDAEALNLAAEALLVPNRHHHIAKHLSGVSRPVSVRFRAMTSTSITRLDS